MKVNIDALSVFENYTYMISKNEKHLLIFIG